MIFCAMDAVPMPIEGADFCANTQEEADRLINQNRRIVERSYDTPDKNSWEETPVHAVKELPINPLSSTASTASESSHEGSSKDDASGLMWEDSEELAAEKLTKEDRRRVSFSEHDDVALIPSCVTAKVPRKQRSSEEVTAMLLEAQERAVRKSTVHEFLKNQGFDLDVNSTRRKLFKTTFPLHVATKLGNEKMVELLLAMGADPKLQDSKRRTPAEVATKYNRDGSHDAVLRLLQCEN
mmetsp:Transcript_57750/g.148561  ORF Transcript_57750/g.148561 Transcript_57750/m.148561 type:complete len:239 (-) Transcript_57750:288-1004(-)